MWYANIQTSDFTCSEKRERVKVQHRTKRIVAREHCEMKRIKMCCVRKAKKEKTDFVCVEWIKAGQVHNPSRLPSRQALKHSRTNVKLVFGFNTHRVNYRKLFGC